MLDFRYPLKAYIFRSWIDFSDHRGYDSSQILILGHKEMTFLLSWMIVSDKVIAKGVLFKISISA